MKTSLQIPGYYVTSVNFNSKKVKEDVIFGRQDMLQFFSGQFKYCKYLRYLQTLGVNTEI